MYKPQQQVFLWLTHTPPQSLDLLWLAGGSPGLFLGTQGGLIQISWPPGILWEPLHHSLLPPGTCRRRHRPPSRGKCLESIHLGQHLTFLKNISINRKEWLSLQATSVSQYKERYRVVFGWISWWQEAIIYSYQSYYYLVQHQKSKWQN